MLLLLLFAASASTGRNRACRDALSRAAERGFGASPAAFRTGWFVESLLTELAVIFVMRTRRPFFRSRPARVLMILAAVLVVVALAMPYGPWAAPLGFVPLGPAMALAVCGITTLYVLATEVQKLWFYRPARRRMAS